MNRFIAATAAVVIALGASAWAAETPGAGEAKSTATPRSMSAPAASSARTTAASSAVTSPATASTVEGTIVAVELTEMVPTITVRRADGTMTKVRVDAMTSVWQDGATPHACYVAALAR